MKRSKQFYVFTNFKSFSLGLGAGVIPNSDVFDVSFSFMFWTFGFRTWKKGFEKAKSWKGDDA